MKIVSFPHYTCGGLLCDILNDTWSPIQPNGGIGSIHHSLGKIGDSSTIMTKFDTKLLFDKIKNLDTKCWIGTHCWLGNVPFDDVQVLNVTTTTYRSKLYRWIRAWHHYYVTSDPWQNLDNMELIDKQRETAKNYILPFEPIHKKNFTNIEFADVVEGRAFVLKLVDRPIKKHLTRWREINGFLFAKDLWSSEPCQRFYEAEYEINLNQRYVYQ